jgi:hypothetical protein
MGLRKRYEPGDLPEEQPEYDEYSERRDYWDKYVEV